LLKKKLRRRGKSPVSSGLFFYGMKALVKMAADSNRREYSAEAEKESIVACWKTILSV
jgi:hypothetical protein